MKIVAKFILVISENFSQRIKGHLNKKKFWNLAIALFSQNNDLTKADVKYLEYLSWNLISEVGNFKIAKNSQSPSSPNLPEHQESAMQEFFEDIKLIVNFSGYDFLMETSLMQEKEIFYCKRRGIDAFGFLEGTKFIILKKSKISAKESRNYKIRSFNRFEMLKTGHVKKCDDDFLILEKDIVFNSPSSASSFCVGNSSNGWVDWRSKEGKSLDEALRR